MYNFTVTETAVGKLQLAGEMTILDAALISTALQESLIASDALDIDLSGVTELDTAGVQIMLQLQREARLKEKSLNWSGHSPSVIRVLDLLNLGRALDAPAAGLWS
jgi:anti-anti-sigma factor